VAQTDDLMELRRQRLLRQQVGLVTDSETPAAAIERWTKTDAVIGITAERREASGPGSGADEEIEISRRARSSPRGSQGRADNSEATTTDRTRALTIFMRPRVIGAGGRPAANR